MRNLLSLLLGAAVLIAPSKTFAANRAAQWAGVDDAVQRGLPRTAITNLQPIIEGAVRDRAWGEAVKGIARRIVLEGNIEGNKPEEKITRMKAEIAKAPREMVPLLDTILANWYWHYFQNNRWRFMQRTQTAQAPASDFTTWDLPRLFAEIDRQFQKALTNANSLKRIPIGEFDALLQSGTIPDRYRPTLYDFIAFEALEFYASGEQAAVKAEDEFEIPVAGPIFGSVTEFVNWRPTAVDGTSPKLKAILLYQEILRFHQNDSDKSAFLDADLARLNFGNNLAVGDGKEARFKAALKGFVDQWADHEVSALALYRWASLLQREENLVEARALALRGANAHRESPGGRLCRNLVADIEARGLTASVERVWNAPWPKIELNYRNLTNVHFRLVSNDWSAFLDRRRNRPESLNDNERRDLLAQAPVLAWSVALPPTIDFKETSFETPAPVTLKPGFYFIIASPKADFSEADNQMTFTDVWVSNLALVVRPREGAIEGFVLEANSGEPLAGAEVAYWYLDNRSGNRVAGTPVKTDTNGMFKIAREGQNRGYLLRVRHNGRELASQQEYWPYERGENPPSNQVIFFTDRAIYRPGQTIQYKGIGVRVDQQGNNYQVLAGQRFTVIFTDMNDKEIARQDQQCNDYGSFSGSFTAPRDRVTGQARIYVQSGAQGQANFNLEEYKRPKFQVTLDAPKSAAKLNEVVALQGKAEAYTGAAVDGALVKWRVVREVRWPSWWGWYRPWRMPQVSGGQEIAHGTARTATDGTFKVEFMAKPDPKVSETNEVSFSFSIYADVTDSAGETRSAQRGINVGFTALQATLSVAGWQTEDRPVELEIRTSTLDGEPQLAEGSLKIYRLKEPATVLRAELQARYRPFRAALTANSAPDLSDPNQWELGEIVQENGFTTDTNGQAKASVKLGVGVYRAVTTTQDRFGKTITALAQIRVLKPDGTKLTIKIPNLFDAPKWTIEPGEEFMALWGTGYEAGRAFVELEHRQKIIESYWTKPGQTQQQIKRAITEAMRGGFTLHVTQIRENRAYLQSRRVDVPWSNKELKLAWEHFTSKLGPSQKETWTAVVSGPKAEKAIAEMVAGLYDQSLDQFMPANWQQQFGFFYQDYSSANFTFENQEKPFQWLRGRWENQRDNVVLSYRDFPPDLVVNVWHFPGMLRAALSAQSRFRGGVGGGAVLGVGTANGMAMEMSAPAAASLLSRGELADEAQVMESDKSKVAQAADGFRGSETGRAADLSQVSARKNLNETAFFFPQLTSETNGIVRMTFEMPEALTTWRFMAFAHDQQLRSGYLEARATTSKDLMVQPNPPRFVREGDMIEFTVKVSNQSTNRQTGKVRLTFEDAAQVGSSKEAEKRQAGSLSHLNQLLGNTRPEQAFDIPAKESRSFSWRIEVPDGAPFLSYKAVAASATVSDGEEGYLPVLSRRIFVTESLPLPIRGPGTKKFEFAKLVNSGRSRTLKSQSVTVQMVSNPAWYAVLALPYLMEFPHECTEQTFNRLYANALARHVANSDPKIRRVFDLWKGTPALDSPLEKNQDLKSVMVEETPWVRQAQSESQARRNVGVLFDANRLNSETDSILKKLADAQLDDGSWPWFPGGRGNDYITLYITTGFGRLRHLGVDVPSDAAIRSLMRLDNWMREHYERIQKIPNPEDYVPGPTDALYLYGRSFFLKDKPIDPVHKTAVEFFLTQARKHWLRTSNRQSQGHLALALKRFNDVNSFADSTPKDILRSLKERSVNSDEMGMFWRDTELSWWWYRAPIETQALMLEAFDEVTSDLKAVEDCRVWLLKQKQTQDWKTTKATADAVYALLLRGKDILASDKLVEVTVGGLNVTPTMGKPASEAQNSTSEVGSKPEPGTGFYERRFTGSDIKPKLGEITVKKTDEGVAWGSVHWQYLEDMSKVTPYQGTPLKLNKSLFTKVNTTKGPTLEPARGTLRVGDELVVRIELRVDRDMEYVHLKDQRGSGTEPVNVLSNYKYQDGLAYYESTRDTASHFYIDYLPKGTYVFEYSTRIQLRGEYQTGIAIIECMYAPEFNSHSESLRLQVR